MALNPTVLAQLIKTNIETATGNSMPTITEGVWNAVAAAIITHLTTAGVVVVASVSGVTTGPGTSGPGIGTIT